jgi:hypothetical protein
MTTKGISLTVPSSFVMPSYLSKATPEQAEHALMLADAFLEAGVTFTQDNLVKQLKEKIRDLESSSAETYRGEAIRIVKAESHGEVSGLKVVIDGLKKQIDDLQKQNQKIESRYDDERGEHKKALEKVNELQDKLQQRIAVQSNSSKRGQEGEKDFQDITSNMKSDWKLEYTGGTDHSADFRSIIHSVEVRFEVKNHKEKVPYTHNVDKFERDMKKHQSARVGVFVALTASIDKLDDSITIKLTEDKQLLLFIPYFLSRDLSYTYDIIEGFIRTMKLMKPYLETKDSSKDVQILTDKIIDTTKVVHSLNAQVDAIVSDHKDHNTKMLASLASLKSVVVSTLFALTGQEQEETKLKTKAKGKKKDSTE